MFTKLVIGPRLVWSEHPEDDQGFSKAQHGVNLMEFTWYRKVRYQGVNSLDVLDISVAI